MLLLDVKINAGQRKCLKICGIDREALCKSFFESYDVIGVLKSEVAKELGFSSDSVKVIAGAGDNAAAAVGTGAVGNGKVLSSLGTSGNGVYYAKNNFSVDSNNALHSFAHADGKVSSYGMYACQPHHAINGGLKI